MTADIGIEIAADSVAHHAPLSNFGVAVDPAVGDDIVDGYSIGSSWVNTSSGVVAVNTDPSEGAAVWTAMVSAAAALTANALVVGDGARGLSSIGITASGETLYDVGAIRDTTGGTDPYILDFVYAGGSAVNYWQLSNHQAGNAPICKVAGSDTHIGCDYWTKGVNKSHTFKDGGGLEMLIISGVATAVNEVTISNAATTNDPSITAGGEANVGIIIASKGTGVVSIPGVGTGGYTDYDLKVGDVTTPDYGVIQFGNAMIGRLSYNVGAIDLDGAIVIRNIGGPVTSEIEFCIVESGGTDCRFALPKSAVGNATYNPRSMLIAGPAPADTDFVKVSYWQTQGIFHNLACDTSGFGADLGVQYDCEIEHNLYVDTIIESTTDAGVTIEGLLAIDSVLKIPEVAAAIPDTAGYGQFWVKDDVPCTPWFTGDTGADLQLATLTGTETFTNKTLTSPVINQILTANADEMVIFSDVGATAVNEVTISNDASGGDPTIAATGDDAAINLALAVTGLAAVKVNAPLKLLERAAAIADTAGYGQLWVKNTTPCELWFTDDAGLDTQIV